METIAPSWKLRIRKIDRLVAKAEQIVAVERRKREEQQAEFEESLRPQNSATRSPSCSDRAVWQTANR